MIRTQIYLTAAEARGVARVAAKSGRKKSQIIREAIDNYLKAALPEDRDRLIKLRSARGIWRGRAIGLQDLRDGFDRF